MSKARFIGAAATAVVGMLAALYADEGGYVNDRDDPGGETNHGVTVNVARKAGYTGPMRTFPKHCLKDGDVCADSIHIQGYLIDPGYEPILHINAAVTEELFNSAVNFGPPRPSRWFQASLNELGGYQLTVDGKIGPRTVAAFRSYQTRWGSYGCVAMLDRLDAKQRAEYDRLIRMNPRLRKYHRGWVNRRIGNVDRRKCLGAQNGR